MERRALLIDALHHDLQWRVARLDQVPWPQIVDRFTVENSDDERVTAGAQAVFESGGVEQHPVPGLGQADHRRVGQATQRLGVDPRGELRSSWPEPDPSTRQRRCASGSPTEVSVGDGREWSG